MTGLPNQRSPQAREPTVIRHVTTLFGGSALAQVVHIVTMLVVVAGFFGPAEYGAYAVAMSYVGIVSSIACLRYELGIVSARSDALAANITWACAVIALIMSFLAYWLVAALIRWFGSQLAPGGTPLVIAMLVFFKALEQITGSVLYRQEAYVSYSALKFVQAVILLSGFYVAGVRGATTPGLLIATLVSYSAFVVCGFALAARPRLFRGVRVGRMKSVLRRNRDFVRYSTPQTLIDNTLTNGINFVLVAFAGSGIVGHYNFMQRIVKAPLGLLFMAVSQVLFRFCAKNRSNPDLVRTTLARTRHQVTGALLAVLIVVFLAYQYFEFLPLPDQWSGLRDYVLPFSFWMLSPFLVSAFATLPVVYNRQRQFFVAATSYNLVALLALTLMLRVGLESVAFWVMGLTSVLYYLGMNRWLLRIVDDDAQS
jgi:O-antigen/teichoic acid export membrane protein